LKDTDGGDAYFYLMSVHTGMRKGAGTLSNVNFVVSGDEADTGIRSLSDGIRKVYVQVIYIINDSQIPVIIINC
jgi:polycystin 1L2